MKRIGVSGASGFIGKALVAALRQRGDRVVAFARHPQDSQFPSGVEVRQLDLGSTVDPAATANALEGLDAIVNLAGETVAGRWTARKKQQIHDSRQLTTRNLVAGLRACERRPRVLVSASASGYYGSRGDQPLTETSPPGEDFLAQVCADWEHEARRAVEFGTRVVCLRQGLVLGREGGALKAMLPPFHVGAGGPLGSGAQFWPWIHLDDDVALYLFAIDRDDVSGPINAVSPDLASNARFAQALGYALRRPALAVAPGPVLKIVLGEFADSLLSSQLMLPAKAEDLGFVWKHESLDRTLLDLLDADSQRAPGTQRFETSEKIAANPVEVFNFFSSAASVEALAPPAFNVRIVTRLPINMQRGATIEYRLNVHRFPVRWKTLIAKWEPGVRFVDYQIAGPYLLWRHQHDFEPSDDGVVVRDTIDYALPVAPLSNLALPMVREDMRRIFDYRRTRFNRLLLPKAL